MVRFPAGWWACALVAAGVSLCSVRSAPAVPLPLAGNWKVVVFDEDALELTLGVVRLTAKNGKVTGTLLSSSNQQFRNAALDRVRAAGKSIELTFKTPKSEFVLTVSLPEDEKSPQKLLGNLETGGQRDFAWLERTAEKKIDPKKAEKDSPAKKAFIKASKAEDEDKKEAALQAIARKFAPDPMAYYANLNILTLLVGKEAKDKAVDRQVARTLKAAAPYGAKMQLRCYVQVLSQMAPSEKLAPLTIRYARQAVKQFTPDDPAGLRMAVLKILAGTLTMAGKKKEAGALKPQIAKLDALLDKDFLKYNIPFPVKPYPGRKSKSNRVAVVELFTGAQCPPCVGADVAFDALLKTYRPREVVLLQYHLHIPGPDPLTNADTEKRAKFYGVSSTPSLFLNGSPVEDVGGSRSEARETYDKVCDAVNKQLAEPARAQLKLTAERTGNKLEIAAEYAGLKKPGKNVRLRFVLVEDVARYVGSNGQRFHHHVVRALPGGVDGFALKSKSGKETVTVDLKGVRKSLNEYLTAWPKKHELEEDPFPPASRPLALEHLKVVAFIQDQGAGEKEILQGAQADVPEAP